MNNAPPSDPTPPNNALSTPEPTPSGSGIPSLPSPDLFRDMIEVQKQELSIRAQELELKRQQDVHAFQFGNESLKVRADDFRDQRLHLRSMRQMTLWIVALIILVVGGLLAVALYLKNEAFAMEVIKAIVFIISGGAGGYGLAKANSNRSSSPPPNPPSSAPRR